jgi:HPr kinase/phosphorylase
MTRERPTLAVNRLLREEASELRLELLAGKPGLLRREISELKCQKPGHAMTGFVDLVKPGRVQVLGRAEISYLLTLDDPNRALLADKIASLSIPCLVVTGGLEPPVELKDACERNELPLLRTAHPTGAFIERCERFLEDRLTATTAMHGVLVDVLGVGVLILGQSGIGKSECALDLILRGHRLVADDIVEVKRKGEALIGKSSDIIRHHMEVRGLGIINVKDLFGVSAVRDQKKVELVVVLEPWREDREYDRLGVDEQRYTMLGIEVPQITLPVSPARNLTTIIEVAARNHLLKQQGHHSALEFQRRLSQEIAMSRDPRKWGSGGEVE